MKILLAIIMSVLPFIYAWYVKPKRYTSSIWRNFFLVIRHIPGVKHFVYRLRNIVFKVAQRMKHSDNARKFFLLMVFLYLVFILYVDLMATQSAYMVLSDASRVSKMSILSIRAYNSMTTTVVVTILSNVISFSLLFYKLSDKLLLLIRQPKFFFMAFLFCLFSMMISFRTLLLVEIVFILMAASCCYPDKEEPQFNGGIKKGNNLDHDSRMAA